MWVKYIDFICGATIRDRKNTNTRIHIHVCTYIHSAETQIQIQILMQIQIHSEFSPYAHFITAPHKRWKVKDQLSTDPDTAHTIDCMCVSIFAYTYIYPSTYICRRAIAKVQPEKAISNFLAVALMNIHIQLLQQYFFLFFFFILLISHLPIETAIG